MKSNGRNYTIAAVALFAFAIVAVLASALFTPRASDSANAQTNQSGKTQPKGEANQPAATPAPNTSTITVRGSGSVSARPDTINLSAGVTMFDKTVKAAQDKAAEIAGAMAGKIKAAGVSDADYSTSQYNVEPVMDYNGKGGAPDQAPTLTGFRVTYILNVTLHDPAKAPALIDEMVAAGANTVYGVNYTFNDTDALSRQAYEADIKDAQARATKLAGLSNMTLGRIINVSDASANVPGPVFDAGGGKGGAGGAPIFAGQQSVQSDLIVTFEAVAK